MHLPVPYSNVKIHRAAQGKNAMETYHQKQCVHPALHCSRAH